VPIDVGNVRCLVRSMSTAQTSIATLNAWASRTRVRLDYVLLDEQLLTTGPNQVRPIVVYRVYLGTDLHFDGYGSSHHQARSNCAHAALAFLRQNVVSPPSTPQSNSSPSSPRTSRSDISLMYQRAQQLGLAVRIEWNDAVTATYHIGEHYVATGHGFNRHEAKQIAAEKILRMLPLTSQQGEVSKDVLPSVSPVARLHQLAQIRRVQLEFTQVDKSPYVVQVKFGDKETAVGQGSSKQTAKRAAAANLLEKLDTSVALPAAPTKGLLKRNEPRETTGKQNKKHVHFVEDVIDKDEQLLVRSSNVSQCQRQQLLDVCQRINIDVDYNDELVSVDIDKCLLSFDVLSSIVQSQHEHSGSSRYQSTVSLSKGDRVLVQFTAHGPSLMRARENVSSAARNHLKQLLDERNRR
jgi:dsRNA-specific ribonuclease